MVSTVQHGDTSPEDLQPGQVLLDNLLPFRWEWKRGVAQHIKEQFRTDRRCSVPRAVLSQVSLSFAPPSLRRPNSNLSSSVCCFSDLWCPLPLCVASCQSGRSPPRSLPACNGRSSTCVPRGQSTRFDDVRVQDMDLPPRGDADNHRIEVVADGLPLFLGA